MRVMRWLQALAALFVLTVSATLPAGAGGFNPNWFNAPEQGPSPNASHVVGNEEGGECGEEIFAGSLLAGGEPIEPIFVPGTVRVELREREAPHDPLDPPVVHEYEADAEGDWGAGRSAALGLFPIPAGLEPGEYPLYAICERELNGGPFAAGLSVLGQGEEFIFEYEPRSYTVIAQRRPDRPVELEPTFTG